MGSVYSYCVIKIHEAEFRFLDAVVVVALEEVDEELLVDEDAVDIEVSDITCTWQTCSIWLEQELLYCIRFSYSFRVFGGRRPCP